MMSSSGASAKTSHSFRDPSPLPHISKRFAGQRRPETPRLGVQPRMTTRCVTKDLLRWQQKPQRDSRERTRTRSTRWSLRFLSSSEYPHGLRSCDMLIRVRTRRAALRKGVDERTSAVASGANKSARAVLRSFMLKGPMIAMCALRGSDWGATAPKARVFRCQQSGRERA
eukprot:scaffold7384_cov236-Pinguiococcus_pyrenoidosus.AAC.4